MKTLLLIFILGLLTACNDAPLRRSGLCQNHSGQSVACSNALTAGNIRKQYIAEVTVPATIELTKLIFTGTDQNEESDQDYKCELDVASGTQFTYTILNNVLTLKNESTTLTFKKTEGFINEDIIGSWSEKKIEGNAQITTLLIINSFDEIRLRKTCNVK